MTLPDPQTMQENTFKLMEDTIGLQSENITEYKKIIERLTAQRDRLWQFAQAQEDYDATYAEFPDADMATLSHILTVRAEALRTARQVLIDHGDIG